MKNINTFKPTRIMVGVLLAAIFCSCSKVIEEIANKPVAPDNYQQITQTGGALERKYIANGPYAVSKIEEPVLQEFGKHIVYYPSSLESDNAKYPVVVMCNGSGTPLSRYSAVAKHFASWGFIVIGTEENYSWNAFGAEMSLCYLERWNDNEMIDNKRSVFFHKVDFNNVGVVGHSQGGIGVINAITDTDHKDTYKTAVSLSPTNKELADNLLWPYDATKINVPILLMAGEGGGDDWVLTLEQMREIYADITSAKLMARRKGTVHNEMLYMANGYVVAWLMWQLQNDEEAAKAFAGTSAEITTNPKYTDIQASLQ